MSPMNEVANQGEELTPEQHQYYFQHAGDSRVVGIIVCATVTAFFCTFFVSLRLLGRRLTHHRWHIHISDAFIILSWVCQHH